MRNGKRLSRQGGEAYQEGRYTDAETSWLAALEQAKKFGDEDTRLATSLNNLALLYSEQDRYAEAEPLARRALEIWEKALGPEHPNVAQAWKTTLPCYERWTATRRLTDWRSGPGHTG